MGIHLCCRVSAEARLTGLGPAGIECPAASPQGAGQAMVHRKRPRMAWMRSATVAAGCAAVLAGGCTSAATNVSSESPRPVSASESLPSPTAAAVDASTTSPVSTSGTVDTLACDDPAVVQGRADIDGDGVDDTLAYVAADMQLVACTGSGETDRLAWSGMGEAFTLADIEPDGRTEVFFGGTTVTAAGFDLATWRNGHLAAVTTGDGTRLGVWYGIQGWNDRTDRAVEYDEWGCQDVDDDGIRELVTAHAAEIGDDGYTVTYMAYRLDGSTAIEVDRWAATVPAVGDGADALVDRSCSTDDLSSE